MYLFANLCFLKVQIEFAWTVLLLNIFKLTEVLSNRYSHFLQEMQFPSIHHYLTSLLVIILFINLLILFL